MNASTGAWTPTGPPDEMGAAAPNRVDRRGLWALAVFALSLLFFWSYHDFGLAPFDEGVLLEGIRLQAEGHLDPVKFTHYSVQYRFFALLFPGGDLDLELVRLVWAVVRAATALLLFLVAMRLMSPAWGLLPVACFLALPGPWHKSVVPFALCLCLWAMVRTLETGSRIRYCGLALALAAAFALHPYTGVPCAAAWLVLIGVTPVARYGAAGDARGAGRSLRWHGPFAATLVTATLVLADFLRQGSPLDLVGHNTGLVTSILPGTRVFAAQLMGSTTDARAAISLSLYLMVVPTLAAGLWLARPGRANGLDEVACRLVLCLVVVGAFNLAKWVIRLDLSHLIQNAAPLWVLLALLLRRALARGWPAVGSASLRTLTAALPKSVLALWLAAVLVLGLSSRDTFLGGIGTRLFTETVPLTHPHGVLQVEPEVARTLTALETIIREHSADGDALLIIGEPKILHYLTGRPSPLVVPVFAFPANFRANPVGEVIAEIRARDTRLIVFDDRPIIPIEAYRLVNLAPDLYDFIMTQYRLVAEVDGVQVRVRSAADGMIPGR